MARFKVGDKVKVNGTDGADVSDCGKIFTVSSVDNFNAPYYYQLNGRYCGYRDSELDKPTKKEVLTEDMKNLEVGDVITDGNGDEYYVLGTVDGKVLNVQINDVQGGHETNSVEVDTIKFLVDYGYYVRGEEPEEDEEVEELTVEQISERLGKTVKVVK